MAIIEGMNKKQVIVVSVVGLVLMVASATYFVARSSNCDTNGIRPASCRPANNRCLPPGDTREAGVDCAEFKYYKF